MIVRPANKADIAPVQDLRSLLENERARQFTKDNRPFHEKDAWSQRVEPKDIRKEIFLVAEEDKKIIGFARGSVAQRLGHSLSHLGCVDELYVIEAARGKGVANKLLLRLQDAFREKGCDHMTTFTDVENLKAQQFYEVCGMRKVTVEYWKAL